MSLDGRLRSLLPDRVNACAVVELTARRGTSGLNCGFCPACMRSAPGGAVFALHSSCGRCDPRLTGASLFCRGRSANMVNVDTPGGVTMTSGLYARGVAVGEYSSKVSTWRASARWSSATAMSAMRLFTSTGGTPMRKGLGIWSGSDMVRVVFSYRRLELRRGEALEVCLAGPLSSRCGCTGSVHVAPWEQRVLCHLRTHVSPRYQSYQHGAGLACRYVGI